MTGVSCTRGGYVRLGRAVPHGSGGYTVWRPRHWVFTGCELGYGDLFGSSHVVVGYEADGCELRWVDGLPEATSADGTPPEMVVLATSPAHPWSSTPDGGVEVSSFANHPADLPADMDPRSTARLAAGNAVMGVFQRTGGGMVLTVGCTDWAHGLDHDPDPVVSRITDTVLERFGATRT